MLGAVRLVRRELGNHEDRAAEKAFGSMGDLNIRNAGEDWPRLTI
jgi:hypothetical protein